MPKKMEDIRKGILRGHPEYGTDKSYAIAQVVYKKWLKKNKKKWVAKAKKKRKAKKK